MSPPSSPEKCNGVFKCHFIFSFFGFVLGVAGMVAVAERWKDTFRPIVFPVSNPSVLTPNPPLFSFMSSFDQWSVLLQLIMAHTAATVLLTFFHLIWHLTNCKGGRLSFFFTKRSARVIFAVLVCSICIAMQEAMNSPRTTHQFKSVLLPLALLVALPMSSIAGLKTPCRRSVWHPLVVVAVLAILGGIILGHWRLYKVWSVGSSSEQIATFIFAITAALLGLLAVLIAHYVNAFGLSERRAELNWRAIPKLTSHPINVGLSLLTVTSITVMIMLLTLPFATVAQENVYDNVGPSELATIIREGFHCTFASCADNWQYFSIFTGFYVMVAVSGTVLCTSSAPFAVMSFFFANLIGETVAIKVNSTGENLGEHIGGVVLTAFGLAAFIGFMCVPPPEHQEISPHIQEMEYAQERNYSAVALESHPHLS